MAIDSSKVPMELRRRAAQHLESLKGTPMAPNGDGAVIGSEVWPIYRPDLDEPAYYEFTVELASSHVRLATSAASLSTLLEQREGSRLRLKKPAAGDLPGRERPNGRGQGFIVVAAGPHDFPVPHWSLDRPPISAQLAADAEGGPIERIVKVDSLSYVGEAKDGSIVARVGQLPAPLAGLPHDLSRADRGVSTLISEPAVAIPNDDAAEGIEHRVKREGPRPGKLEAIDVKDWPSFRERYSDAFGPFLDALRRQAAGAWEVEGLIGEFGEGIRVGQSHRVALLQPDAVVELGGPGASLVKASIDERGGAAALVLEAPEGTVIDQEADLDVDIRYPDGQAERLRFFVISDRTPSNRRNKPTEGRE
jgi:hypothetical protein